MLNTMIDKIKRSTILKSFTVLVVMLIIAGVSTPYFYNIFNIQSLLRDLAFMGMISIAQGLLIIVGDLDLSVGAMASLAGVITAMLMVNYSFNPFLSILLGLLLGVLMGILNGLLITKLKLNSMVATIGMQGVYNGITLVLTKGRAISNIPDKISFLGTSSILKIPIPFIITIFIGICAVIFVSRSKIGRYTYAIGNSNEAALILGIPVAKVKIILYAFVGFVSALAGILYVARLGSAQSTIGAAWGTNSIASSVLGGIALSGGVGNPIGALIGAALLSVIQNLIVLFGVNVYWQTAVSGIIVVLALSFSSVSEMLEARRAQKKRN